MRHRWPTLMGVAALMLAATALVIGRLNAKVERSRPLDEQFARAGRDRAAEAEVAPLFDELLGADTQRLQHTLECRGRICRLEVLTRDGDADDESWMHRLQTDDRFRRRFNAMSFTTGAPKTDPVTRQMLWNHTALMQFVESGRGFGMDWLQHLVKQFEAERLSDCQRRFPGPGIVSVRIAIDDERGLTIARMPGGAASPGAIDACVIDELHKLAVTNPAPKRVSAAVMFKRFSF
jgi:hypothetical protein